MLQHHPQCDIEPGADRVDRGDLSLEIGHGFDRALVQHHILVAVIARDAVTDVIENDAQIAQIAIGDRRCEARIAEQGEIDLACRQRGDHRRRSLEMDVLSNVGLAGMLGCAGRPHDRRNLTRHDDPCITDFDRLGGSFHGEAEDRHRDRPAKRKNASSLTHFLPPIGSFYFGAV